jgi:hypothetical protein
MIRSWLVAFLCVPTAACFDTGLGRGEWECGPDNCYRDEIYLHGALAESADQPLAYTVTTCVDAFCSESVGECAARSVQCVSEHDVVFSGGCDRSDDACTEPELWQVAVRVSPRRPNTSVPVASASIRVTDSATDRPLVDERFELEYVKYAPSSCHVDDGPFNCLRFDGTWPDPSSDAGR